MNSMQSNLYTEHAMLRLSIGGKPHSIRAAIFDMDGTLLDSMRIWDNLTQRYLKKQGRKTGPEVNEAVASLSLPESAVYLKKTYGLTQNEQQIAEEINAMIAAYYQEEALLKPGVKALLQVLKQSGVRLCVATATDRHLAESALKRCGVHSYFETVFTCTEAGSSKTKPDIYRQAAVYLGADKTQTLVFEDALFALRTASDDGFLTVAVYDEHEAQQEEMKRIADIYLRNFFEFEAMVGE